MAAQGAEQYRQSRVHQVEERKEDAYPHKFNVTHRLPDFKAAFDASVPNKDDVHDEVVSVAGRVVAIRESGKALRFITLQGDGESLQVLSRTNDLEGGEEGTKVFQYINRGDIIGVRGKPMRSKTGELSISTLEVKQLSTCFHMVPTSHSGFKDMQFRFRQRYLDLIMNDKARKTFVTRSKIITYLRRYFDEKHFLEVETPMMNTLAGGATARPFKTHHNELNIDMFMRIAPELYLKMLIVGGLERVYEIGRNFRNEGIDLTHNPEFTMLEFYWAYVDYKDLMKVTQELLQGLVKEVTGGTTIPYGDKTIDFSQEFGVIEFIPSLEKALGVKFPADLNTEEARATLEKLAREHKVEVNPPYTTGRILDAMMGQFIEPSCQNPTFIIDHPKIMSPLAKWHRKDPLNLTERFELFVAGRELCNAYTELNAPIVQRATFEQQAKAKAAGDDEAQPIDEGFIRALEYGLPPTGGFGMGIDRLTMLLTDQANIREVILFPTMRPNEGLDAPSADVVAAENAAAEGDAKHGKPNHPVGDGKKAGAKPAGKGGKAPAAKVVEDATLFDFRVGKVLTVERHPDADSLYVETIDVGEEKPRQIVSGLVKYISQEEFVGKDVIIFANLQAKPLRGKDSFGMVLCAEHEVNGEKQNVELVQPPEGAKPGDKVAFGSLVGTAAPPAEIPRKTVERLMPKLKTDENGVPTWDNHQWTVNGAPCRSNVKSGIVK